MVINTWNDGCMVALRELQSYAQLMKVPSDNGYEAVADGLAACVRDGANGDLETMTLLVKHAGALAMHTLLDLQGKFDTDAMHSLLCSKQHDYGHGNIMNFGMIGVAVRLCDKIARAANLKKRNNENAVANETVIDTYADIVGYAVIGIMLRDETFQLELGDSNE